MYDRTDKILVGILILLITIDVWLCSVTSHAEIECLKLGYPRSTITMDFETYCSKFDRGSEVTLLLRDAYLEASR